MYSRHTRARPALVSRDRPVPARFEVGDPRPQGQRVVLAQRLHVAHLEAGALEGVDDRRRAASSSPSGKT